MQICGKEYTVNRERLKGWLQLEEVQKNLARAIENRDKDKVAELLCSYVSIALGFPVNDVPWNEVALAYSEIVTANKIRMDLPMFKASPQNEESVLDYVGRDWYEWAHLFASEYGWSLEYIAELDVEDAMGLMQELVIQKQAHKEWEWSISPNSIGYDKATKKSKFVPLPRPSWMVENPRGNQPKTVKMPIALLPIGNIISWKENVEH